MTPFERHNLKQLSPSALLTFQRNPALWCLKWRMGIWGNDEKSPRQAWGVAVESGLGAFLHGENDFHQRALDSYDQAMEGIANDEALAQRALVIPTLDNLTASLRRQRGSRPVMQMTVRQWLPGIECQFSGKLDFKWPDRVIVELKSTKAIPSKPNPDHLAQLAYYCKAEKLPGALVYAAPPLKQKNKDEKSSGDINTAKRVVIYRLPISAVDQALRPLISSARAIQNLLSRTTNANELASLLTPDFSDFRWTEELKTEALKIWKAA